MALREEEALGNHLFAAGGGLILGAAGFLIFTVGTGHSLSPHYPPHDPHAVAAEGAEEEIEEERPTDGEGLYVLTCGACHQADGAGMAGAFPPLAGSEWVSGDPETPIRIALLGVSGKITVAGTEWDATMPPPVVESDEELAKILTYVRDKFGGGASAVTAAQIDAVRKSYAGRTDQWTAAELEKLRAPADAPEGEPAPEGAEAVPAAAE